MGSSGKIRRSQSFQGEAVVRLCIFLSWNFKQQGWRHLSNWGKTLADFKASLVTSAGSKVISRNSGPCALLKSFVVYAKMNQAGKAMTNLAIASLDVANRLRANAKNGDLLPDLPTSFDDWEFEGRDQLSNGEAQFLRSLFNLCSKTNSLRLPLDLASMLSPIILLAPIHLHKQTINSYELVKVSKLHETLTFEDLTDTQMAAKAGNKRPHVIATVERAIWEMVFSVARGERALEEAAQNLAEALPWLEIEAVSQNDWISHWFDGVEKKPASVSELVVGGMCTTISPEESEAAEGNSSGMDCDSTTIVSQPNIAEGDDGGDVGMDCDLVATISQPHPMSLPLGDVSQAESQYLGILSKEGTELLHAPHFAPPTVFGLEKPMEREPLFLPDSDDERDGRCDDHGGFEDSCDVPSDDRGDDNYSDHEDECDTPLVHKIRQALFEDALPKSTYSVVDGNMKHHTVEVVYWVSEVVLDYLTMVSTSHLQSEFLEPLKDIIADRRNSGHELRYIDTHIYKEKSVEEIQQVVKAAPLIVIGEVTDKSFGALTLAEIQPLTAPIEVSGKVVSFAGWQSAQSNSQILK